MSAPTKTDDEPPLITIGRGFPRIAQSIELLWGHPELDDYLSNLILTDRSGREGFPSEVLNALLKLHNQHVAQFNFPPKEEPKEDSWVPTRRTTRSANR